MNIDDAIKIIDTCNGFSDEDTIAGEAWEFVKRQMDAKDNQIAELKAKIQRARDVLNNHTLYHETAIDQAIKILEE